VGCGTGWRGELSSEYDASVTDASPESPPPTPDNTNNQPLFHTLVLITHISTYCIQYQPAATDENCMRTLVSKKRHTHQGLNPPQALPQRGGMRRERECGLGHPIRHPHQVDPHPRSRGFGDVASVRVGAVRLYLPTVTATLQGVPQHAKSTETRTWVGYWSYPGVRTCVGQWQRDPSSFSTLQSPSKKVCLNIE
jgi:hypothetical protein